MTRGACGRLLVGASLIALAATVHPAAAQNLVNPSGSTVLPGFIKVDPGETFDNVFNFGTIAGNGASGAGIEVEGDGRVFGDVRNRGGGIIALTGATGTGILVTGASASIGDDVDNFGLIRIDTTGVGYGMLVQGTNQFVGGDIANRGEGVMVVSVRDTDTETGVTSATATASDASAHGIHVTGDVTGIDDIANFGAMRVEAVVSANAAASDTDFAFADVSLTGDADAIGLYVAVTQVGGAVLNAGRLEVDAVAHASSVAVATGGEASVELGADIVEAEANAIGIEVDVTTLSGGFANVGSVDVAAVAEIIDRGTADATTGDADAYIDPGDIIRFATATATGVYIHDATRLGGILNLGTIDATADALVDIDLTARAATGGASAYIDGTIGVYLTVYAFAYGLYVGSVDTIETGVLNVGDVAAVASAVVDVDLVAIGAESATAYIRDVESTVKLYASASASGVSFVAIGLIDGDLVNAGDVDAMAVASVGVAVAADAGDGDGLAFIAAINESALSMSAVAEAMGFSIQADTAAGDLVNSGDIDALANAAIVAAVAAEAASGAATAYMFGDRGITINATAVATGLFVPVADLDGDLENSGDVAAAATASIGIDVAATAGDGGAKAYVSGINTSVDFSASASARGIKVDIERVDGSIINSGAVGAHAIARLDTAVSADATNGDATAWINATAASLQMSAGANATGVSVSVTTLEGDLLNSGDADVLANAAVLVSVSATAANGDALAFVSGSDVVLGASATAYGIYATLTTLGGGFDNSGDVAATAAASVDLAVDARAPTGAATAYVSASEISITASAQAIGATLKVSTLGGGATNSGDIVAAAGAFVDIGVAATGGGDAFASIYATASSISIQASASADGLVVTLSTVGGSILNSGAVEADAVAHVDIGVSAYAAGSAVARIAADDDSVVISASASASGVNIDVVTANVILNSGDVQAHADARVDLAVLAHGTNGNVDAYISSSNSLTISADASVVGITISVTNLNGSATNSGDVTATASAVVDVGIRADTGNGSADAYISSTDRSLQISATATAYGIYFSLGGADANLVNSGALEVIANAGVLVSVTAIAETGSASAFMFADNSLTISAEASAYGVHAEMDVLGGDFLNSGEIDVAALAAVGIQLRADSDDGNAYAAITDEASGVDLSASASAYGMFLQASTSIGGGIANSGDIDALANAAVLVALSADSLDGTAVARITARTDLNIGAEASAYGIFVDTVRIGEDFTNSGDILAGALATVGVTVRAVAADGSARAYLVSRTNDIDVSADATAYGIAFDRGIATVAGDVANSGEVNAVAHAGVVVTLFADAGDLLGDDATAYMYAPTGIDLSADATATGIALDIDQFGGDVTNSGALGAGAIATVDVALTADGGLGNAAAYISADDTSEGSIDISASADAHGLNVTGLTIAGGVENSGDVEVTAYAAAVVSLSAYAPAGQAQAYIVVQDSARAVDIDASVDATGLEIDLDRIGGDVVNSGDLRVTGVAGVDVALFAGGGEGSALAYIDAAASDGGISITVDVSVVGISLPLVTLSGDFENSGAVDVVANGAVVVALTAYADGAGAVAYLTAGTSIDISASVSGTGIDISISATAFGNVTNTGDVTVLGQGTVDVTLKANALDGGEASAFLFSSNSVSIYVSVTATGLDVDIARLAGDFSNGGDLDLLAIADVDVQLSAYASNNNAFAHISASSDVVISASASANGIDADIGTLSGDFTNSGDMEIAAVANAGVALTAVAEGGSAFAYIHAISSIVAMSADASAYGIEADITTIDDLSNSGDLVVDAAARLAVQLSAYASGAGLDANAYIDASAGVIDLNANATAYGVFAAVDTVSGNVGNSGLLDVAAVASVDVTMDASATGGDANAYLFGEEGVNLVADASAYGLIVDTTAISIAGALTNSGDIVGDAQATIAIDIEADPPGSAQAYLSSHDSLTLDAQASAYGIAVNVDTLGGTLDNSGDLDISAVARIDVTLDANAGSGSGKAFFFASTSLSVTAEAAAFGIAVDDGAIGSFANSGAMEVDAGAAVVLDFRADSDDTTDGASAFINSTGQAISISARATASGIRLSPLTMGSLGNSGDLDVGAQALLQISLSADGFTGFAEAYLYANGSMNLTAAALARGVLAQATTLGPISNSGDITATARADVAIALRADVSGTEDAHISASSSLTIYAGASAYGVEGDFTTLNGGFANSGDITSVAVATLDLSFDASNNAINATTTRASAAAHAFGVSLVGDTINGDVTNDADIVAHASAYGHAAGLNGGLSYTAYAFAVAFHLGNSGVLNGDYRNGGLLAAIATAYAHGAGTPRAIATAIGLDVDMDVTGDVVNSGTIVASASADSAYAYGIRVIGHAISGSIQNTGIIAAFADGDDFTEAFSIQLRGATGPTTIEQLDGFIIGDINLDNTVDQADTIEFSGGEIRGGIFGDGPAAGDELVAFRGVDATLNITGDIDGLQSINVNPLGFSSSSLADVELRIGGDVTNTGNLNVNTHGTLVVGLFSDITVTNYRQVPTGTTLFEVNAGGENGTIYPDNVQLAGTVGIRPAPGLYADNQTYVVIDSPNLIGSTYDNVRSTALLQVEDDYSTPTEVHLNVTRIAFDAVGGLTHNQNAVGGALEADYGDIDPNSDFGAVVGSLFGLSQGEYQDALDDLAGAEHAQMLKIGAGAIQSIDNALMGRLAFVRGLSAEQMASVDGVGMAFAQVASTGDVDLHMDLAQAEAQAVANPGSSGIWARVFGGTSTLDGDDEAPGFDTDNGGVSVGIDHRLSPDAIVGLYGGYAHADASFDTDADGSVDTYQVGVYGSWASGGLHVDGMVSGAWQSYELKRSIDFLGRRASSDYDGWAIGASAQVGYDIALGSAAVIEPMAGLDYIHLETDGFSEDGADSVDLNVESGALDSLKSSLGVRITAQIDAGDGMVLIPTASVAWEHEFLEANGGFTASFDGSPNGTTFDIIGSDDEADAAAISLGLALTSDNMTAFVGYDGKISGDSSAHQGTIGIRFGF